MAYNSSSMKSLSKSLPGSALTRRKFIASSVIAGGGMALVAVQPVFAGDMFSVKKEYTVQQIIDLILKEGNLSPISDTVDTLKSGRPDQVVTGVVTTMFATIAVIEQAVKLNANFIIAHEPTFYNHTDSFDWVKDSAIVKQKQQLLDKHKIAVWRFHDYCHRLKPDAIRYGVIKKAGWLSYDKTAQQLLTIPPVSLKQLVQHLKSSLGITHLRIIGKLDQQCERIALMPGAAGGQRQMGIVETEKPDVLIVGELSEWETAEYIRDGQLLGAKTSLIILGHAVSEEPGMEWLAEWLQPKIADVKITHVKAGDAFTWL
jgi:putative NIF3 family GTP cyclohydrolase 1 type 2